MMPVLVITPELILMGLILITLILFLTLAVLAAGIKELKRKWKALRSKS